jgi:thiol-disulfide isomerase/thioredoxin
LEKLAAATTNASDHDMWLMQFADTVGAAAQTGAFPAGTARLNLLREKLEKTSDNQELIAHVVFTHISSEYAMELQADDVDYPQVQQRWVEQLDSFVETYPSSQNAPEAMLQIALAKEFAGEDDDAIRTYSRIVKDFPESPLAVKAAGAKRRLESVGKPMSLAGRAIDGKLFDLKGHRGSVVLVHYWATWCEPCKQDMEVLAKLKRQFTGQRFEIVGVNLDSETDAVARFFRMRPAQWTHLYEKGGLDSRLANEMGVLTLPIMLLIDTRGHVVNRQVHTGELESAVKRLLR